MKHPLNGFQRALRETYCYFFGHKWKSSWHRNGIDHDTDDDTLPYGLRHSGNPYWEYSLSWHYRCRRCRRITRGDAWHPWYKGWYWAVRALFRNVFDFSHASYGQKRKSIVALLGYNLFSGLFQFFALLEDERHWPWFPAEITADLQWWFLERAFEE